MATGYIDITNPDGTTTRYYSTEVEAGTSVDIESLSVTENGTYTAEEGSAYSPVTVTVSQPTLFAPVVTGGVNEISWANNEANGNFEVTLTADVDGTTVTSPLTITEQMDGSTLTITASATNFQSVTSTITLAYMDLGSSITAVSAASAAGSATELFELFTVFYDSSFPDNAWANTLLDGVTISSGNCYVTANGVKEDKTISQEFSIVPKITKQINTVFNYRSGLYSGDLFGWSADYQSPSGGAWSNKITGTITLTDTTTSITYSPLSFSRQAYSEYAHLAAENMFTWIEGHIYTININATISPI